MIQSGDAARGARQAGSDRACAVGGRLGRARARRVAAGRDLRARARLLRAALAGTRGARREGRRGRVPRRRRDSRCGRAVPDAGHRARPLPPLRPPVRLHGRDLRRVGGGRERLRRPRQLAGRRRRPGRLQALAPGGRREGARDRPRRCPDSGRSGHRGRIRAVRVPAVRRLRRVPRGRDERERDARDRVHALRRGERPARRPHAHDGLRVPRRPRALRAPVGRVRRDARAGGLPRPLPERRRRRARERGELRQPAPHPRPRRLADLQGLAQPALADPRGQLLQVARAGMARRPAHLREPARREQGALRGLPAEEEQLRRNGRGAARGEAHPRAPGLHRRAERRPRQRLVPHRHRPLPGPPGHQPGQARGRAGHRGVRAVRLPGLQRPAEVRRGPDRQRAERGLQPRRPRHGDRQQVRQRAGGRGGRHRHDRRAGEQRQQARDRQVLADAVVPGPAAGRHRPPAADAVHAQHRRADRQRPALGPAAGACARSTPPGTSATRAGSPRSAST